MGVFFKNCNTCSAQMPLARGMECDACTILRQGRERRERERMEAILNTECVYCGRVLDVNEAEDSMADRGKVVCDVCVEEDHEDHDGQPDEAQE